MSKFVYDFNEGNKDLKDLLGGKGANLAEMTNLGLPVPPGFTITTEACTTYLTTGSEPPERPPPPEPDQALRPGGRRDCGRVPRPHLGT